MASQKQLQPELVKKRKKRSLQYQDYVRYCLHHQEMIKTERTNMIYMTWMPAGNDDNLQWFEVSGSKKEAVCTANEVASMRTKDSDKTWKVAYVSVKSGKDYTDYCGKNTIVVQQKESYYHGA